MKTIKHIHIYEMCRKEVPVKAIRWGDGKATIRLCMDDWGDGVTFDWWVEVRDDWDISALDDKWVRLPTSLMRYDLSLPYDDENGNEKYQTEADMWDDVDDTWRNIKSLDFGFGMGA